MSESYVALTEQLAQIKAQEEAIQAQLAAERDQVRTGLIESLKAHIERYGFSVEEIATAMLPKRRGAGTGKRKGSGTAKPATTYRDKETGNTYSKGRIPDWLRAGMLKHQLDPTDKASMKEYKQLHMEVVEEAGEPMELQQAA
jgi:DNA-binding protein H-NS